MAKANMSTKELQAKVEVLRAMQAEIKEVLGICEMELAKPKFPTISSLPFGTVFDRHGPGTFNGYIKCRPTSFILNSTLVAESLAASKCFICNLDTGSMFIIQGTEEVMPRNKF